MMVLHIAPDYFNTTLYQHLFEALQNSNSIGEQYVYACDNVYHESLIIPPNVHAVNHSFSMLERLLYFPKQRYLLQDIESTIPCEEVQLTHAHTLFSSGYLAYKLYKKYHIPYIVAIRNTDVNVFFKKMPHLRPIGRKIAEAAQKVIFISPAYKTQVIGKYLPEEYGSKSIVIPNGINNLFFENISQHIPNTDTIRLIYIGRLEKNKNIRTIIRVADYLKQRGRNVKLCLVGKIIDKSYTQLIEERDKYIEWHDQCSQHQIINYLRQNDIFIMPSYTETFGLAYVEAMTQGLPVIYTKGQGFDGFFDDGTIGYAVSADDVQYISKKIIDILNDYKYFSDICREKVLQFKWQLIADKYAHIYNTLHPL